MKSRIKQLLTVLLTLAMLTGIVPGGLQLTGAAAERTATAPAEKTLTAFTLTPNKQWIENSYGYWDDDWFWYYVGPEDFAVDASFDDGSTETYANGWEMYFETDYELEIIDPQTAQKPWGLGKHTVTAKIGKLRSTVEIEVVETPVKSISVNVKQPLFENADGYQECDWDSNDNPIYWFYYQIDMSSVSVTVNYKDGSSKTYKEPLEMIADTGYMLDMTDDQSFENQWGLGKHPVTFEFMGVTETVQVEIAESPVKSIVVTPKKQYVENVDGSWDYGWDIFDDTTEWFRYAFFSDEFGITVNYKDGTSKTYAYADTLEDEKGYWLDFYDEQSAENPWSLGKQIITVEYMGARAHVEIEIVKNPVKSISVSPKKVWYKDSDGYIETDWDDDDNETEWFCYDISGEDFVLTVNYTDGTTKTYDDYWDLIEKKGYPLIVYDDQSFDNLWSVGKHTISAEYMGVSTTAVIEITESPVQSISLVSTGAVFENSCGEWYEDWETGGVSHYYYDPYFMNFVLTVNYKDGRTETYKDGEQLYNGTQHYVYFDTDQDYDKYWGLGKHMVTAEFAGCTATAEIEIIANPVERITVTANRALRENIDGEQPNGWFRYSADRTNLYTLTVYYKDGTTKTYNDASELDKEAYRLNIYDDQSFRTPWSAGKHTVTAEYMGFTVDVEIEITALIDISAAKITGITDRVFDGRPQTQNITVALNGKTLKQNTDYTVTYANNVSAGTASITVKGIGNYTGTLTAWFKITAPASLGGATGLKASKQKATTLKLTWNKVAGADGYIVYNGNKQIANVKTNSLTVKKLKAATDYTFTVKAYKGKLYGAAATVKTATAPKKPALKKPKAGKKSFKLSWKKVKGVSGYEIAYGVGKKPKKFTVKRAKAKAKSYTANKLKSKKTYTVKIRAFKKVGSKRIYSTYSKTYKVKVK